MISSFPALLSLHLRYLRLQDRLLNNFAVVYVSDVIYGLSLLLLHTFQSLEPFCLYLWNEWADESAFHLDESSCCIRKRIPRRMCMRSCIYKISWDHVTSDLASHSFSFAYFIPLSWRGFVICDWCMTAQLFSVLSEVFGSICEKFVGHIHHNLLHHLRSHRSTSRHAESSLQESGFCSSMNVLIKVLCKNSQKKLLWVECLLLYSGRVSGYGKELLEYWDVWVPNIMDAKHEVCCPYPTWIGQCRCFRGRRRDCAGFGFCFGRMR